MNIIGLTGKKFHGKDTVAKIIHKYASNKIVCLSFAKPIKQALSFIHVIPMNYFDDPELKEKPLEDWEGITPRQLAQWLGTDVYRDQFSRDIWLKNMELRIAKYSKDPDCLIIITDCRFDNEAEFIKKLGGMIWMVDASMRVPDSDDIHSSENGVHPSWVDQFLDNNGSYEDLDLQINAIFNNK